MLCRLVSAVAVSCGRMLKSELHRIGLTARDLSDEEGACADGSGREHVAQSGRGPMVEARDCWQAQHRGR